MNPESICIINGSPKPGNSTSAKLAGFLLTESLKLQSASEIINTTGSVFEEKNKEILATVSKSDVIFLIQPMYTDTLSYNVVYFLELLFENRNYLKKKKFAVLAHCGLNTKQNHISVSTVENFVRRIGWDFAGSLTLGYTGLINGISFKNLPGMTRNMRKSLQITAQSLCAGEMVSQKAVSLMRRPIVPITPYIFMIIGNIVLRRSLKKKSFNKGLLSFQKVLRVLLP